MRITIIPHNPDKVRELKINNFLILLFVLLIIIPVTGKYFYSKEFLDSSKIEENNKQLEKKLKHYTQEHSNLTTKISALLTHVKNYQSIVTAETPVAENQDTKTIDELLTDLQESRDVLDKIYNKLQDDDAFAMSIPSISPVQGVIIQTFGETKDIFTGEQRFCQGVDFSAVKGSEVYATAYGRVEFAGFRQHSGLMVKIDHGYGFKTVYSHLSFLKVRKGKSLKRGDIIGFVGTTGKTIGPALHYEVWIHGEPKNPLDFISTQVNYF